MIKFSLTKSGIIYIFFSILLFNIGFFKGELLTTVCGAGLCLYFLQSCMLVLLTAAGWKNINFNIKNTPDEISIISFSPDKSSKLRAFVLPGILLFYTFIFFTEKQNKNSKNLKLKIKVEKKGGSVKLKKYDRGLFFINGEYLEVTDIAGFFSFKFFAHEKSIPEFISPPEISCETEFKLPEIFDEVSGTGLNIRRTEEFYESRPYIPGDDIRKMNWRLFAHTNEPAINQGDFLPPPQKFFAVYIEEPVLQKRSGFKEKIFDVSICRVLSIIIKLYNQGFNFNILLYDYVKKEFEISTILGNDKEGVEKIKAIFAKPQVKIFKNAKDVLTKRDSVLSSLILNKLADNKNHLLYFKLPSNFFMEERIKNFTSVKNKMVFYSGPLLKIPSPKNFLDDFLFFTLKQKKEIKKRQTLNLKIKEENQKLLSGGFYGYEI